SRAGADDMVPVIVQTRDEPSEQHLARLHGRGGTVKMRHHAFHGYSGSLPAGQIEAFADDPEVEHVSFDEPVRAHMDVAYQAIGADRAFADFGGLDGRGIGIALIDTGVEAHDDLMRARGFEQPLEVEVVGHEPGLADPFGHGTHVAGILNGNGADSSMPDAYRHFRGIAPGARLISIRALAADGSGYSSDIITGIDWAIAHKDRYNIRVLNLSLGHPVYESYVTDPLCRAARAAVQAGIVVVAAAGNDGRIGSGYGTITVPGNEPSVITVGAMDDDNTVTTTDDVLAWYSSKGPTLVDLVVKPDIVAPGTWIVSLRAPHSYLDSTYHDLALQVRDYRTNDRIGDRDGAYYTLSGTSMAAPMVAGAAALMLQKDPSLTPATVKARLMKSAVKDDRLVFETGAGYLDIDAALNAEGIATGADSPQAVLGGDGYIYIQDTALIWGSGLIWGQSAVWGGAKGRVKCVPLAELGGEIVTADGAVWRSGGRVAARSAVDNDRVTGSTLIWGGAASILPATTGTVDMLSAVWGNGKGRK
ncbi:MAG TPA: S8 family serine peptidase, partial [Candidatus Polarisedimenticolia bacterium]|nr:S8 family serine peptidase [Candidatus Polarisedimenticolia bacterium]